MSFTVKPIFIVSKLTLEKIYPPLVRWLFDKRSLLQRVISLSQFFVQQNLRSSVNRRIHARTEGHVNQKVKTESFAIARIILLEISVKLMQVGD